MIERTALYLNSAKVLTASAQESDLLNWTQKRHAFYQLITFTE
jgi:hypothetical protein